MRADLNGHLKALKDYFLLEKGDFFQVNRLKYLLALLNGNKGDLCPSHLFMSSFLA